jgi:hypothetical protein
VALLDPEDVRANLLEAEEIPAAIRWAELHEVRHDWDEDRLIFKVWLESSSAGTGQKEEYLLIGTFPDYRVMPPEWRFVDPRNEAEIGLSAFPHPGSFPSGSILHGSGVICAPWNHLAYGARGGPHPDWQDAASWQTTAPGTCLCGSEPKSRLARTGWRRFHRYPRSRPREARQGRT